MTNNVINFPIRTTSPWEQIYSLFIDDAMARGLSNTDAIAFVESFKPVFESFNYSYSLALTVTDDANAEALRKNLSDFLSGIQSHISKLIKERYIHEITLYLDRK